jgi:CheY-like chemotaxis protein
VKTILVLEDDAAVLGLIRWCIERDGYSPLEATTAAGALQRFEENDGHIDLLIADCTLAVSSGIRVALELRSLLPCLPIILTSGYPPSMWNQKDRAELEEFPSDCVQFLQKPFQTVALLAHVHNLIGEPPKAAPTLQTKAAKA